MKKLHYLFLSLIFANGLKADIQTDRSESQPNQELSIIKKALRALDDFIGTENLGYFSLSSENEMFIKNIIHDLNMDDYCIEIRGMSNYAKRIFGRTNAFVLPSVLFNKKSHAHLYVSEEWFNTLSQDAKDGLIRHELMHLKEDHVRQKADVLFLYYVGIAALFITANNLQDKISQDAINWTKFSAALAGILVIAKHSRSCEKEADIKAARTMTNQQGLVDLFENMKNNTEDPKSKYHLKRFLNSIIETILSPFSTHPKLDERIKYITNL